MRGHASSVALLALWGLVLIGIASTTVLAQQASPSGGGYNDPAGTPLPPRAADIEPVYRGPSVDTLATIRKRGVLRVGISASEPMVMFSEAEEPSGFSIDVARRLAEDMGVGLEFVPSSWSHIIPDLLDKRFDIIISGLWVTPERALVISYTSGLASEGIYLLANQSLAANLKTREAFNQPEVRIAVYGGTIQERVAASLFPRATLLTAEGDELELSLVTDGKAHAVLVPTFAPQLIVQGASDKLFLPFAEPLQQTVSAAGVRKGDPDFVNYLNSCLAFYRDSGWLQERTAYWSERIE